MNIKELPHIGLTSPCNMPKVAGIWINKYFAPDPSLFEGVCARTKIVDIITNTSALSQTSTQENDVRHNKIKTNRRLKHTDHIFNNILENPT